MKDLIKSALYRIGGLRRSTASRVIYYHDVFSQRSYTEMGTPLGAFCRHVDVAKLMGFTFVRDITEAHRQLMICFDDGFRGIWDNRQYFFENRLCPTVFMPVNLIGKDNYLTRDEILLLQEQGFVFQGHSWNHDNLPHYSDIDLRHELWDAKEELQQILGKEVDSICFPQGYFSDRVIRFSLEAGYKKLYSSLPGGRFECIGEGLYSNLICRSLMQGISLGDFKAILQGGDSVFRRFRLKKHLRPDFVPLSLDA